MAVVGCPTVKRCAATRAKSGLASTLSAATRQRNKGIRLSLALLALGTVGGCDAVITTAANISGQQPSHWVFIDRLPVELYGSIAGLSEQKAVALSATLMNSSVTVSARPPESGSGKRVVMFVNGWPKASSSTICDGASGFRAREQSGTHARVNSALCDGRTVISTASGWVLTQSRSIAELASSFRKIRDRLCWTLNPLTYADQ
jgi:hypothetical protein